MEELDEFGIPIKKSVDEFGIPVKGSVDEYGIPMRKLEVVGEVIGAINPMAKGVYDLGRTIYSGFTDTAPQTAAQALEVAKTAINPSNINEYIRNKKSVDFQRYVRDKDPKYSGIGGFFTGFDIDEALPKYGSQFMKDEGLSSEVEVMEKRRPEVIERRKGVEQYVAQQKKEAEEKLGGVVTDYRDIDGVGAFSSYVGNLLGQATYQIPLSAATKGGSSYLMESATVYDGQLDRIAKELGISREEVIERNLDDPAKGQAYAILAGALDAASAGNLISAFRKGGGQHLKKWLNLATETITEPTQGVLEEVGSGGTVGEAFSEEGRARRVNELLGGLVGGGAFSLGGTEQKVKSKIKQAEAAIDQAINEVGDTGDSQLNADIDAAAAIDPVDKQVLEEVKVSDAIQTEQKEVEADEKLQKDLQEGTESTENTTNLKNAENTATNAAKEAEIPISQTPEYKEAVDKVEKLQKAFAELDINESADQLLFDLREARQSLQKIAGKAKDTRKKTPIQKQIEDATGVTKPEKSIKMTPSEAIKHQVQTFYRGVGKGVKKGKELTNDLVSKVQEAIKEYPLSAKQTSQILTKIRKTNLYTPGSVSRLNTFIDKISADAQYAEDLSVSQDLQGRIRKKSKTKVESIPRNYKAVAKDFGRIKPEDVDNLSEYQSIANEIVSGFGDPKSNKYASINETRVRDYITRINGEVAGREAQRVREEFGFGDEITNEEIQMLIDSENLDEEAFYLNKEDTKRKITRDKILQTAEYSKLALDDITSDENQSVIDNLKNAPLDDLSDGQLVEYVRVVDNVVENDEFSNTARIEAQIEAVNNAKELLKLTKGKKGEIGIIKGSLYNVPMMFNAIYSDSDKAAKVQLQSGLQDVYNGGSRVESSEHELYEEFQKEAKRIKQKYGKTPLEAQSQVRRGVFGTLVRYPKGADPIATLLKSKNIVAESINRLKGNKDRAEIAADAERAFEPFRDAQTIDEVFAIMKKVDPAGLEMWQYFNKKFETDVKDRLKQNAEQIFNEEFVEEENYTPKVFEIVDSAQSGDLDAERAFTSDLPSKPKQSKTAIRATNALPAGRSLNFEFDNNMFRKYRESMYDIETSKPRLLFREFMRLPAAAEILGGLENKQRLSETYRKSEEVQRGIGRDYSDASKLLDEVTGALRTLGYTAALGSADQFIKQYIPVATNTMWNLGGDSGLFFSHVPKEADKLFNLYTIGQRGRRLGGAERGESIKYKIQSQYRNKLLKATSKFHRLTEKGSSIFMYSLTQGDVSVAKRSWAAYYLKYLKDNGVDLKTVNLANEHTLQNDKVRREAASFAEQKVKETQVVSNPSELAKLLRTAPGAENWIKNIFIPFSTFAVNTKVRVIENIRQIRTNENKPQAYRALAGTVSEIALYSTIKYFILSEAYKVLKGWIEDSFNLESEEEDDDDFKFKQWYSAILKDFFPLAIGTMGENLSITMANRIAHIFTSDLSYDEWKKEQGETFYSYKVDSQSFDLGLYSVGLDRVQETVQDAQTAFTGEAVVSNHWGEKEVTLDTDQQKFMAFMLTLDAISSMGFMDAGLYNTFRKIKREQLRGGGESGGTNSQPSRPRPRPRPRPARNMQ